MEKLWSERNQILLEPRSLYSRIRRGEFVLRTVLIDTRGEEGKEIRGQWEVRTLFL